MANKKTLALYDTLLSSEIKNQLSTTGPDGQTHDFPSPRNGAFQKIDDTIAAFFFDKIEDHFELDAEEGLEHFAKITLDPQSDQESRYTQFNDRQKVLIEALIEKMAQSATAPANKLYARELAIAKNALIADLSETLELDPDRIRETVIKANGINFDEMINEVINSTRRGFINIFQDAKTQAGAIRG